ncbi:LysR substrate-binding domain-containing protein [Bifidobacterium sp. ESL0732]|uniref:LysR substrate-binding domain-containing protein n=1 Tax=Bifidobacterium sp. ESL0732 TaxID=2983222 RepID=UPI0023F87D22|nr:LysR substrate-binding domain-containing protein [Bifidobacterium sp. ESL0732]WEV63787.1 LysR substrate-binding domain-containing protein [Bifidobacterium sp. ESL0732]
MQFQQLKYVVAVAEERNFTRAAERCLVGQSALSHQIRALEEELGVELFARTSRRVELTQAGEAFLPHAKECLKQMSAAKRSVATETIEGSLTIGVISTATAIDFPEVLSRFHAVHPAVGISLQSGGSDVFIEQIRKGSMDVALLGVSADTDLHGLRKHELMRERLVAVLPVDHRLVGKRSLRLSELAQEPFIDFPAGGPGRRQTDLAFRKANLARTVTFEAMEVGLMVELAAHGLGVALLPPGSVPASPGIRAVPVIDGPTRVQYLAWSQYNSTAAAQAFVDDCISFADPLLSLSRSSKSD